MEPIFIIPKAGHYYYSVDDEWWPICANPSSTEVCGNCVDLYAESVAKGGGHLQMVFSEEFLDA